MSRYGNVTILPADPNPWADALGLIGGIMGKNAADRQDAKDTDAFVSSITPAENPSLLSKVAVTNPTAQAPNQSATTGGLLGGNVRDNVTAGLTPNTSFLDKYTSNNPAATTQAVQTNPQQTQPQTWNDIQNQYNTAWGTKVKATLANMSPEARKQYLPQIMQMREQDLATLKNDWTKKETANNWDLFNAETDPKKKLFLGTKLSLPAESMKMLLEPDTKTQLVNMGGKYVQVGTNAYTGKMINMETGQPLTAEDLQMTMTPYQEGTLAETSRHNGVMESRPVGGSGGGSSGGATAAKNFNIPGVGVVTTKEAYDILRQAEGKDTETTDEFGNTKVVKGQKNEALANMLRPLLIPGSNGGSSGGEQTYDTDEDWYSAKFQELIGKGFTEEQAYARMDNIINGK